MRSIKGKRQIRKGMYRAEFIRFDNVIPVLCHQKKQMCASRSDAHLHQPVTRPQLEVAYARKRFSKSELLTTDTLDNAMAAPASAGAKMPTAAIGIMMQL